jgi:lipopolysaccharide transport system ATP-binding protein
MSDSSIAIRAEGLGKRYRIGDQRRYKALRDSLTEAVTHPVRAIRSLRSRSTDRLIWVLRDISFEISSGEVVGFIGRNGAGKSTLLKILSRITAPTSGQAEIWGRVGSLLEVGTGFHPELTGRENVFLNGAIIGMKHREIQRKFDEIVDFADVSTFLDTQVKFYSSGMYMRLAFSVAAHLEPEILLVDEVLAVGDSAFQKKCIGKMGNVAREGRTVLFVSHNLAVVNQLCGRVFLLDEGRIVKSGTPEDVVAAYIGTGESAEVEWRGAERGTSRSSILSIDAARISDQYGQPTATLESHAAFHLEIDYTVRESIQEFVRVGFVLRTLHGITVFDSYDVDSLQVPGPRLPGTFRARCRIEGGFLNPGRYVVSIAADVPHRMSLAFLHDVMTLDIEETHVLQTGVYAEREGIVRPRAEWSNDTL